MNAYLVYCQCEVVDAYCGTLSDQTKETMYFCRGPKIMLTDEFFFHIQQIIALTSGEDGWPKPCDMELPPPSQIDIIFPLRRLGHFSKIARNSSVSCCSNSFVTLGSTYENHSFFSFDKGIAQFDHLHTKLIQKHATTVGLYCRHIVVR